MKWSGWCIDNLHGDACRWTPCACTCHHAHAAEMVAQTFDRGAVSGADFGRITGTNESARQCANTVVPGLTATKERLHE